MPERRTIEEFKTLAKAVHGEKYDYSQVIYANSKTKVTIICPLHGAFQQTPFAHLTMKQGCPSCARKVAAQKLTMNQAEFLRRAREIHGDKYDYGSVVYKRLHIKVTIICPEHGKFSQEPSAHIHGKQGCPQCGIERRTQIRSLTVNQFVNRAVAKHGDRYDYSKVDYKNSNTKVCIVCPTHGEFWQRPLDHIHHRRGCRACWRQRLSEKRKWSPEEFIERAKTVHGNKYDYSKTIYIHSQKKVCIICPEHGEFWQVAHSHISGTGCMKCNLKRMADNNRLSTDEFIRRVTAVHNGFYDYSKVEYAGNEDRVCIICPEHGEFWQTARDHMYSGAGCPVCGQTKSAEAISLSTEQFVERAVAAHGNKYDYSKVEYKNSSMKVCIICPIHGAFEQWPKNHMNGQGCPSCNESQGERTIALLLDNLGIRYKRQKQFRRCISPSGRMLRFDFNFIYHHQEFLVEYDGIQHFEPMAIFGGEEAFEDRFINDRIKDQFAQDYEFVLIRIPYYVEGTQTYLIEQLAEATGQTFSEVVFSGERIMVDIEPPLPHFPPDGIQLRLFEEKVS